MTKTSKSTKLLSLVLSIMMVLGLMPGMGLTAYAAGKTIQFVDSQGWGTAYVYAWDDDGNGLFGDWPGTQATETTTNEYGETVFTISLPENVTGIVVNNGGGQQTEDITDFSHTIYYTSGAQNDLGHYRVSFADAVTYYASYVNTTTVVHFDGKDWYLIEDNSTAVDAGTVTLLSKDCVAASQYNSSRIYVEYASSTVKTAVDNWYNNNITSNAKTAVFDNKMFLLTKEQANAMTADTRKCSQSFGAVNFWWLCSPGSDEDYAACVSGSSGNVAYNFYNVDDTLGVRPALKLDLSKVSFDSTSNTFMLPTVAVTSVTLDPATASMTVGGDAVALTATVEPNEATDKTVKWSVGGTDAGAVKLYSDEDCTTEVGTDATETLTVYAKGISAGSATVTVTSNADSTKSASCAVTVNKADPTYIVPTGLKAVCGNTLASVTLPEHWTWADDTLEVGDKGNNIFKATFTPENTDKYNTIENVEVTVSVYGYYSANDPTCEEDGNIAYYEDGDGNLFTDLGVSAIRKEQTVIEKLNHKFINFLKWVWDGFNKAVAWLFCDNNNDHIETVDVPSMVDTVDTPDCTHGGYRYHVATIDVAGEIYTTVNVETLDQLGHDWYPAYDWDYDGFDDGVTVPDYYLKVTLICNNDEDHQVKLDVKMERIENEDGSVTFIGHCEYDGVDYTDSITVKVEPATPDTPATPDEPTPDVPTPDEPTPATPDDPTPDVPTPDEPTPVVPTPDEPTPVVPTPDEPTPVVPTPDEPTPVVPTPDEPEPEKKISGILGDVNNDGVVDSADALMILRNSVGLETFDETQNFLGDVNEDGENIDSSDALAVLRYSAGVIDNEKIGTPVSKTVA